MSAINFIFYFFLLAAGFSAAGILLVKNVMHAALLLIVCLLSIAGLYVLLHAEFLAVTQVMVYAGGVLILIIFGVMLSSRLAGKPLNVESARKFPGFIIGAGFFFILAYSFNTVFFTFISPVNIDQASTVRDIGFRLMSTYVAPFEVAGVLLLISLIGAAVTASFLIKNKSDAR